MRRRVRGALVLVLILIALLWLSGWRAKTMPSPEAPASITREAAQDGKLDRVIIMATDDTEYIGWSTKYLSNWDHAIYSTSAPPDPFLLRLPIPPLGSGKSLKAAPSMAVLTFIIDYYDSLPQYIAHIQPSRSMIHHGTHFDHANAISLHSLNFAFVAKHGFANLRCSHHLGCDPPAIKPIRRVNFLKAEVWQARMSVYWSEIFGTIISYPGTIATPSGGQFVVAKWQVLQRSKSEYEHYRSWLTDTFISDIDATEMFESLWHVIFGRNAVYCPDEYACACEQFNRC